MNDRQENQVTMMHAVKELCDINIAIWTADAPFTASYTLFTAQLTIIDTNRPLQLLDVKGAAIDKQNKRILVEDQTVFVASRIHSYAVATSNQELLTSVNFNRSELKKARDTQIIGMAKLVKDKGTANLAALAPYGITAGILTALTTATTNFQNVVSQPTVAKTTPIAATKALNIAIKTALSILNTRLDFDVEIFKAANLTFYNQYFSAREIIDLAPNKLALKCSVTGTDGKAIANVTGKITETGLTKKTTAKGTFQLSSLAPGTYHMEFTKNGYVSQTILFYINAGETTEVNAVLVKV